MSWNVQNLFDGIDDGTEYAEFDPSSGTWNQRLYLRRLERTGEVTSAAVSRGADLVVFQELESPAVLNQLADGPLRRLDYPWRLAIAGYGVIRCGVLSRYPITDVTVVECGEWNMHPLRPALAFTVGFPGENLRVIALHWKSPRDGREPTEAARRMEAGAVRRLAEAAGRGPETQPVLIIGDLNTPGDGAVRPAAVAPWPTDGIPTDTILLRSPRPADTGRRDGNYVFFDPEPDPGAGPPGTYWFRGGWDRPDRALLSREFLDGEGLDFTGCRVAAIPAMLDGRGRPRRWITANQEGYSDHLPLILEFETAATAGGTGPDIPATKRSFSGPGTSR